MDMFYCLIIDSFFIITSYLRFILKFTKFFFNRFIIIIQIFIIIFR